MQTSIEIRWFYPGTAPPDLEHWFLADCPGELRDKLDEREDVYLYTKPICEYLNIKLRQGLLDIKWRKAELGIMRFGNKLEGKVEKWLKWICEDPAADGIIPAAVVGQQPWISVNKSRLQRLYKISTAPSIILIPVQEISDRIFAIELTKLNIQGSNWWSLAFEVIGEEINLIDSLKPAAEWVFKTYQGDKLTANHSFAYPKWLSLKV